MAPRLSVTDRVDAADLSRIKAGLAASDPALGPYAPLPLAVLLHDPERSGAGDDRGDRGALSAG